MVQLFIFMSVEIGTEDYERRYHFGCLYELTGGMGLVFIHCRPKGHLFYPVRTVK